MRQAQRSKVDAHYLVAGALGAEPRVRAARRAQVGQQHQSRAVLAPRPVEQTRPFLRVYGAFDTAEEAREHAAVIAGLDPSCSLLVVKMREWSLMPQTEDARDDPAAVCSWCACESSSAVSGCGS